MKKVFLKYQHIERVGTVSVRDLLNGKCFIFPKIDGSNSSVWISEGKIKCGAHRREISAEDDNAGFYKEVQKMDNIKRFLQENPELRLYGEWLVPHKIKNYKDDAWKKFYVFDVGYDDVNKKYLSYEVYSELLDKYDIEYIKPLDIISNPTIEDLQNLLDTNTFLMQDEKAGEGIIVKRYDYINQFGLVKWGKIVRAEYQHKNRNRVKRNKTSVNYNEMFPNESNFLEDYLTESLIIKEQIKLTKWSGEDKFPRSLTKNLIDCIYKDLVCEDLYEFIEEQKGKNKAIDFKVLKYMATKKITSILFPKNK